MAVPPAPNALAKNCTAAQVQFSERESNMALTVFFCVAFQFFSGPHFMDSLHWLNLPRRLVMRSAPLLNLIKRFMLMRQITFSYSITVILLSFSFAGCGGYSGTSSVNGNGPVAPYVTTQPANQTVTAGQTATFSVVVSGTA